jgi:hypothetical protein
LNPPSSLSEIGDVINKFSSDESIVKNNTDSNKAINAVLDYLTSILIKIMSEARYCCSANLTGDLFNSDTNDAGIIIIIISFNFIIILSL